MKYARVFHLRAGTSGEVWAHFEDSQAWDEFFA